MNKYIRTKDGIYEVKKDVKFRDKFYYEVYERKNKDEAIIGLIDINKVISQADTIEELCDEFVVIEETQNYAMEICSSYEVLKDNGWIGSNFTIYGAIWTSKGLIYVAKLNENGGLELWD